MYLKMSMIAVVIACSCQSAGAAILYYEGFDYPNDTASIVDKTGGTGWAGPWIDTGDDFQRLSQDDTSLSSPAFPFTPIGDRTVASGNGSASAARDFTTFDLAQDGVFYASFLWRKEQDGGASGDNVEFNIGSVSNGKVIRIGSTSGEAFLVRFGSGNADYGSLPLGETLFTVLKVTASELTDDTMEVTFYDSSESVPTLEPTSWDATATVAGSGTLSRVRLEYGANAHGAHDEIRFGTTWGSVTAIPEPTSMALVVMSLGAALAFMRRH